MSSDSTSDEPAASTEPVDPLSAGPALELEDLHASHRDGWFSRRAVLRGVDLAVARGETLALVGTNGSGKSTLLRIAAGLGRADAGPASPASIRRFGRGTAGSVRVLGRSPEEAEVRRRIGYVPEDSPFPPEVRALEVLVLLGTLRELGAREARARGLELLEQVGLSAERRTRLGRFSRGMSRRFALAQAELHRPELLLLDEPTAGLDAPGLEVFEGLLASARARGAAILFASHLATDVTRNADRLAVLHEGRIAADGPPGQLLGADGLGADGGLLGLYRRLAAGGAAGAR